ncbi:MAG: hypothetical protein ACRDQ4_10565 [Pseudonocardiaceae bacterium]
MGARTPGIELIVNDAFTGPSRRGFQELLGDQKWQALLGAGTLRSYRPGSFLLRQGGVPTRPRRVPEGASL